MKLKKGDQIKVVMGKDRGRKGKITKIIPKAQKVLVAGINTFKKHLKPQGEKKPGGIIDVVKPLPTSNVALICPKCGKITRIGYQIVKESKLRICKKCKAAI